MDRPDRPKRLTVYQYHQLHLEGPGYTRQSAISHRLDYYALVRAFPIIFVPLLRLFLNFSDPARLAYLLLNRLRHCLLHLRHFRSLLLVHLELYHQILYRLDSAGSHFAVHAIHGNAQE